MDTNERRELEKLERKNKILEAALQLFSEKDFHEVTVDEIAERVSLSKGTLYLYFENKDNLFFSIIESKSNYFIELLHKALDIEDSFIESLREYTKLYLTFFEQHSSFFKIVHSEKSRLVMEHQNKMREWAIEINNKILNIVVQIIEMGQRQKLVRNVSPTDAGIILRGVLNSYVFQRIFMGSNLTIDQETDQVVDIFLYGIKA